jgi:hypothetical protein
MDLNLDRFDRACTDKLYFRSDDVLTKRDSIKAFLEINGGKEIGSRALNTNKKDADYDFIFKIEDLMKIRNELLKNGFVECNKAVDYNTLIRFKHDECNFDVFALTEESYDIYIQTHNILKRLPYHWLVDKTSRVILTNAIQNGLGRCIKPLDEYNPNYTYINFTTSKKDKGETNG